MYIYIEVRTNRMKKVYEGTLEHLEHFPDHILVRIKQSYGKGAIVSARHEDIVTMHIIKDTEAAA